MRPYSIGIVVGLSVALVGVVLNSIPLVILGLVAGTLAVAITAMRGTQAERAADVSEGLSPESRILLRPLRKIYQEMQQATQGKSATISPYIATEALSESKKLLDPSAEALQPRDQMIKETRAEYTAQRSASDLESRLAAAKSADELASLESALAARKQEISHYDTLQEAIAKIESSVKQAEATMAEMKAKLASASAAGIATEGSDPLQDTVGRMRALSDSLTEAQEMLEQGSGQR